MDEVLIGNIEQLYEETKGVDVYIYGAKSVALRAFKYLEIMGGGTNLKGYVVSNRYNNPDTLYGKKVYRIENENKHYDCMVVAVNGNLLWKVRDELLQYDIGKLVMINPLMDDDFRNPAIKIVSSKSKISEKASVAKTVQIVTDETSSIIIDDNVVVGEGSVIIATDNSNIYIGEQSCIGENVTITAEGDSEIVIGEQVVIAEKDLISSSNNSQVKIKGKCHVGADCIIGGSNVANIVLGKDTSIQTNMFMLSDKGAQILIGDDCMFSYYIKMNAGSHRIIDKETKEDITNTSNINIGDHVWCGMGVTVLPGSDVGTGSIIGASSLINSKIPNNCTCAGNPVRVLRKNIEWFR